MSLFLKSILLTLYLEVTWATKPPATEYFSEAFIRVFACSLNKKPQDLEQLLKPAMDIANRMDENGKLSFLGYYASGLFHIFFQKLHIYSYNDTITYLRELKSFMENRREQCSAELNEIIDTANSIILKTDGENIYGLIDEYKQFPNVKKTGEQLCQELIEAFVNPFFKIRHTGLLKYIVERINDLEGMQCDISFKTTKIGNLTDESANDSNNKTYKFWKEGLLTQAYIKFLEIVIDKRDYRVREVLKNAESVVDTKRSASEFDWMGRLKSIVPEVIGNYFTYTRISILKEELKTRFYDKITNRTFAFDGETNEVIDLANKFITKDQKKELDEILEDFEKFPDSESTAKEICAELIDAFSRPFKENKQSQRFDNFLAELTRLLKREYPEKSAWHAIENPAEMNQYW